jgi:hypothetical protein
MNKIAPLLLAMSAAACASAFAEKVTTRDAAINLAVKAIHQYHLTTLKDDCGRLDVREEASWLDVDVVEVHDAACGGDPQTQPRLFTVRVRKSDGRMTSDVYDSVSYLPVDHELAKTGKQ